MTNNNWERYKSGKWKYVPKPEVHSSKETQEEYMKHIEELLCVNGDKVWSVMKKYIMQGVKSGQLTNRAIYDILDDIIKEGGERQVCNLTRSINSVVL